MQYNYHNATIKKGVFLKLHFKHRNKHTNITITFHCMQVDHLQNVVSKVSHHHHGKTQRVLQKNP